MKRLILSLALMVVVALAAPACGGAGASGAPHQSTGSVAVTVTYAVDGDTLRVRLDAGEDTYVRLVGIDTPEDVRPDTPVECGARAAAASMDRLAPEGAHVLLRFDSAADRHDRYGRLLAHAFVDGQQLEVVQLRRGWAAVYRFDGQRFDGLDRFERAERAARRAGRGVWSACGGDFHSS
jgi:micrococcal nuclease